MRIGNKRSLASGLIAFMTLLSFFSACTPSPVAPGQEATPSFTVAATQTGIPTQTQTLTPTVPALAKIELHKGDFYFTVNGRQSFLFSRNLAGYETGQYTQLLDLVNAGGSRLVRIQLDSMGTGITSTGAVDEAWVRKWEHVFDQAAAKGINVLPVFSGWFDWNNGTPDYGYSTWKSNAFNAANGGPAANPGELFEAGSNTQKLWLQWMKTLVERWVGRENLAAWEIFSEVNIASGTTEANGTAFIEQAAAIIRSVDVRGRPITASLADVGEWPSFYRSDAIDFINYHPYPYNVNLDLGSKVVKDVRALLDKYHKPVIIGESGLNTFPPDSESGSGVLPNARLGLKHAVWAEMVSGAMNGRSLYWEDGFAIFFPSLNWEYLRKYADLERPAADFVRDVDFAGFRPLTVKLPPGTGVWGAAVGSENMVVGWFRDAQCEPPNWPLQGIIFGQTVSLVVPGSASQWKVDFYDTNTGLDIIGSTTTIRQGDSLIVLLPDFKDDIAFKMYPGK